jgi:hypothetical protein
MPQMRLQSKQAGWYRTNCRRGRQVGGLWLAAVAERGTGRGRGRRQQRWGTAARQVGRLWAAAVAKRGTGRGRGRGRGRRRGTVARDTD